MKIGILGAGALGSAVGGALTLAGHDVELWDLNEAHIQAVNDNGLKFDGETGSHVISLRACRPEEGSARDAIILLTKTLHTEAALKRVSNHIDNGTMVLTAQNGLGNAEKVLNQVPEDQVLYGCTMMPARFIAPGHVASQSNGKILFRSHTDKGEKQAIKLVTNSEAIKLEFDAQTTDRIIWQKAAFNCALNSIVALYGGKMGVLNASEEGIQLAKDVAKEVIDIAHLQGIEADQKAVFDHIEHALAKNTDHKPSMLQDMEARRPTEIDSLCGEITRQAEKRGVSVPLNKTLTTLIKLKSVAIIGEST